MSASRRLSRELALQVLFQQEFATKQSFQSGLDTFRTNFSAPPEVWDYAAQLLHGVEQHLKEIDTLIQTHSAHWALKRMALVDLNIMRIGVFEMKFGPEQLPPAIAINESIEIGKKYGSVDSAAFVNGILDQIMKH